MDEEHSKPLNLIISVDRAKRLFDQLLQEGIPADQARMTFIHHSLNISNLLSALMRNLSSEDISKLLALGEKMTQQPNYQSYIYYVGTNKKLCPVYHFDQVHFSAGMSAELENAREKLKVLSQNGNSANGRQTKLEEILLLGLRAAGAIPFKDKAQIESFYMAPVEMSV